MEAASSKFKQAKAALNAASKLVSEVEAQKAFENLDFVPPALSEFAAQIAAAKEAISSAKISAKITQVSTFFFLCLNSLKLFLP